MKTGIVNTSNIPTDMVYDSSSNIAPHTTVTRASIGVSGKTPIEPGAASSSEKTSRLSTKLPPNSLGAVVSGVTSIPSLDNFVTTLSV